MTTTSINTKSDPFLPFYEQLPEPWRSAARRARMSHSTRRENGSTPRNLMEALIEGFYWGETHEPTELWNVMYFSTAGKVSYPTYPAKLLSDLVAWGKENDVAAPTCTITNPADALRRAARLLKNEAALGENYAGSNPASDMYYRDAAELEALADMLPRLLTHMIILKGRSNCE